MNIEKCPFCGGSDVRSERNEKDELMYCACLECGAFGPAVYSPSGSDDKISFKAWNTRKHLMSSEFAKLKTATDEAKIRLYGILWLLVEHEIISEGRARELGNMPLHKMIDKCMEYRVCFDDEKPCTCHPNDNHPVPCAKQYALSECLKNNIEDK